jgi:hypothetical protein
MTFEFADKHNFENGGSIVVLFYGAAFLSLHLMIILTRSAYVYLREKINNCELDKTKGY